jgi:hypothetical protein
MDSFVLTFFMERMRLSINKNEWPFFPPDRRMQPRSSDVIRMRAIPLMMVLALTAGAEEVPLFKVEMKDGVVAPQRLEVPAGKPFRLEVKNTGKTAAEFECKSLKKEKVLAPGVVMVVDVKGLTAGEYSFVDEYRENLPTGRGVIFAK